jgi:plasmid stability protein
MAKRMTVIFEDDALYTALKVEAARKGRHAKDIVAEAVSEWLEAREDEELRAGLEEARDEWQREGGVEAGEFFRDLKAGPAQ